MTVDDTVLLAYVNDALPPAQRDAIDAMLLHNPALREQVRAMQASRLPYQAAFAAQALPELPKHLHEKIMEMTQVCAATQAALPEKGMLRQHWKMLGGLAAAVVLGIGLQAAGSAYFQSMEKPGWIMQVATYQSLYVRDTLQNVQADPVASRAVMNRLYQQERIHIDIPDMSRLGLQFKRVQRLGLGERPLMQMVYLPEQGDPVALCVIPENGPDAPPTRARVSNMDTVKWRRAGLAYVLVAAAPLVQLQTAANLLYENKLPSWSPDQMERSG